MAVSNREYVGRALDTLAGALDPFIDRILAPLMQGAPWTAILHVKDGERGSDRDYARTDLQCQLRVLTERLGALGFPFADTLSRGEQNLAGECRDIRNRWAHNTPFSPDDAYRALDTVERLLRAVGAVTEADTVKQMRRNVQRGAYEQETRKATRVPTNLPATADTELPPWREVLAPHPDVASGRYNTAEFAADLYAVAITGDTTGSDAGEYADPVEFFRRTYLTDGLRELLRRAVDRLSGDRNAQPVINLQTTFGGGKTHSMLAVWHLFSGRPLTDFPQDVQDLLTGAPTGVVGTPVRRVALVGNEIPAGQPTVKPDGTRVHTLWGELAWQLGGAEAYALVAEADRTGTSPGAVLRELFTTYGPAVILVDEWVAYARQLPDEYDPARPVAGGLFETQFTFAQALTLAAEGVPGTLLLVSVPASDSREGEDGSSTAASDLEVGGDRGRAALYRLDHTIRRVAFHWSPATRDESYEIVRRRLFTEPDDRAAAAIAATARKFREFYRRHPGELPAGVTENEYEQRIKAAYPVHPELLDRLYADWSTLEKFQRTRGVLRLMSAVVHQLYLRKDPSPLIMPGSVPLDAAGTRSEVVQYLDNAWDAIIQTDIDGEDCVARRVDGARPLLGARSLTLRTARTIFLGSAPTVGAPVKGVDRKRITLGIAMPGDTVGNISSALDGLQESSSHYYTENGRFWYDTQPSLNRLAAERAAHLNIEAVHDEVVTRLGRQFKGSTVEFAEILPPPESTGDIPEHDGVRLVAIHPRYLHTAKDKESPAATFVHDLLRSRGTAPRTMVNSIVAVAADEKQWTGLESAVRSYLAWRSILEETAPLNLTQSNAAQAETMTATANRTVDDRVTGTWIWGLHAVQDDPRAPFVVGQLRCDGTERKIPLRVGRKYVSAGELAVVYDASVIRLAIDERLLARWNRGSISVGELLTYFARYPYLQRLRDRRVLTEGLRDVLHDVDFTRQGFALAESYDEQTGQFAGLAVPLEDHEFGQILDTTLVVRPDLAVAQRHRERAAVPVAAPTATGAPGPASAGSPIGTTRTTTGAGTAPQPSRPEPVRNATYEARIEVDPTGDLAATLDRVTREVLVHLQSANPEVLTITLDVSAERSTGFDPATVRVVRENGTVLGFTRNTFEDR